jgi:hypothetical protein
MILENLYNNGISSIDLIANQASQLKNLTVEAALQLGRSFRVDGSNYPYVTRPLLAVLELLAEKGSFALSQATMGTCTAVGAVCCAEKAYSNFKQRHYTSSIKDTAKAIGLAACTVWFFSDLKNEAVSLYCRSREFRVYDGTFLQENSGAMLIAHNRLRGLTEFNCVQIPGDCTLEERTRFEDSLKTSDSDTWCS